MTRSYTRVDDAAVLVWEALEDAKSKGLNIDELCDTTHLKKPQVRKGIRRLKEILQIPNRQPIACTIPGYRYVLTQDWPESLDYILNRLRDLYTRLEGMEPTVEAAALKWGRRGVRRSLSRTVTYLRGSVGDLLEEADAHQR